MRGEKVGLRYVEVVNPGNPLHSRQSGSNYAVRQTCRDNQLFWDE